MYGPRVPELFENAKIVIRKVSDRNHRIAGAYDDTKTYTDDGNVIIVPYSIMNEGRADHKFSDYNKIDFTIDLKYALAFILSKLESFYFSKRFATESLQGATSHTYPTSVRGLLIKKYLKNNKKFC